MKSPFSFLLIFLTILSPLRSQSYDSFNQPAQDLIFFEIRDATLKSNNQEHFFESGCDTFQQGKRLEADSDLHQGQCSNHYQNVLRMHAEQLLQILLQNQNSHFPSLKSIFQIPNCKIHVLEKKL